MKLLNVSIIVCVFIEFAAKISSVGKDKAKMGKRCDAIPPLLHLANGKCGEVAEL